MKNNPKLGLMLVAWYSIIVVIICWHVLSRPDDKPCSYILPPKYKIVYNPSLGKYGVWRNDLPRYTAAMYVFPDSCIAKRFIKDRVKYN